MFNKIYVSIKNFIKENYLLLLLYLVIYVVLTFQLPYYIYVGGGTININDKIEIKEETKSNGSYNLCYVSELQATIPTYLLSYVIPNWERVKIESITLNKNETDKDVYKRDKIEMEDANQTAIKIAYEYANKEYSLIDSNLVVIYKDENSNNNLEINDSIISIDNKVINDISDIDLSKYNINDKLNIKVRNNNKEYNRYAYIYEKDNKKLIGISLSLINKYKTNPEINIKFKSTETGPSGGLMLSLAIYDKLADEDITKGMKIAGTGTIDKDGNAGSIGGIKYKLAGAVKSKADIFIVPNGENYKEAIELKNKKNYKIKIIGVDSFYDCLNKLKEM